MALSILIPFVAYKSICSAALKATFKFPSEMDLYAVFRDDKMDIMPNKSNGANEDKMRSNISFEDIFFMAKSYRRDAKNAKSNKIVKIYSLKSWRTLRLCGESFIYTFVSPPGHTILLYLQMSPSSQLLHP